MSIEDRLYALADQARSANGDAHMADPNGFTQAATAQAPDMFGEIKALGTIFAEGGPGQLASHGNTEAQTRHVADAAGVSIGSARHAVNVATRLGGGAASGAAPATGSDDGWAGDSVVVGGGTAQPQPQPQPQPHQGYQAPPQQPVQGDYVADEDDDEEEEAEPWYKNKMVLGIGGAVVLAFLVFGGGGGEEPQTGPQIPQGGGGGGGGGIGPQGGGGGGGIGPQGGGGQQGGGQQGGGQQGGGQQGGGGQVQGGGQYPPLASPNGGQAVTQAVRDSQGNTIVPFSLTSQNGNVPGQVLIPAGGWDSDYGIVGLWQPGSNPANSQAVSYGRAQYQGMQNGGKAFRVLQIQWDQDGFGMGPVCVMFSSAGQDVNVNGSVMCVGDGQCQQAIGCTQVR